jgi:hypothetical protein
MKALVYRSRASVPTPAHRHGRRLCPCPDCHVTSAATTDGLVRAGAAPATHAHQGCGAA